MNKDTCSWCGRQSNKLQRQPGSNFTLCLECCPNTDKEFILWLLNDESQSIPSEWHFMSIEEKIDWLDGLTIEQIMDKYRWDVRDVEDYGEDWQNR